MKAILSGGKFDGLETEISEHISASSIIRVPELANPEADIRNLLSAKPSKVRRIVVREYVATEDFSSGRQVFVLRVE